MVPYGMGGRLVARHVCHSYCNLVILEQIAETVKYHIFGWWLYELTDPGCYFYIATNKFETITHGNVLFILIDNTICQWLLA